MNADLLTWALSLYLVFAALHATFPILLAKAHPGETQVWLGQFFPAMALLLILIPLLNQQTVSLAVWPAVLLIDLLAIGLAILTTSIAAIALVLLLTALATGIWLFKLPQQLDALPPLLLVIGAFAILFFVAGQWAGKKILARLGQDAGAQIAEDPFAALLGLRIPLSQGATQIPALSAILPFLLLMMATSRMPLTDPTPVFGLGLVLVLLLQGLAVFTGMELVVPASLACVLGLEQVWHSTHFSIESPKAPLAWYLAYYAAYTVYPFLFAERWKQILPWATAAAAGPLQFLFVYAVVSHAYPNGWMGLLPAAFAVPVLAGLWHLARHVPHESPLRLSVLAWFGASALFFITADLPDPI